MPLSGIDCELAMAYRLHISILSRWWQMETGERMRFLRPGPGQGEGGRALGSAWPLPQAWRCVGGQRKVLGFREATPGIAKGDLCSYHLC